MSTILILFCAAAEIESKEQEDGDGRRKTEVKRWNLRFG